MKKIVIFRHGLDMPSCWAKLRGLMLDEATRYVIWNAAALLDRERRYAVGREPRHKQWLARDPRGLQDRRKFRRVILYSQLTKWQKVAGTERLY
jgi:hypothetical protein